MDSHYFGEYVSLYVCAQASRVDKLQTELSSQREKLEEANRMTVKVKELKQRNEGLLESKATLEDEIENLQSKVTLLDDHKTEIAQLKAQVDSSASVSASLSLSLSLSLSFSLSSTCMSLLCFVFDLIFDFLLALGTCGGPD